jgi:hypothetical protein
MSEITFSRNHNGDALVLVDGNVAAIAKECSGYDYVEAHILAFSSDAVQARRENKSAQSSQAERVKELEAENVRLGKANNILCRWKSEIDQRRIILGLPFPVDYDDSPKYAVRSLIEALNQKGGE